MSMKPVFDLDATQWADLRRLLGDALARPAAARAAWLAALPEEFAALRPKLQALLGHLDGAAAEALLATLPKLDDPSAARPAGSDAPETVGPYRLLRELGRGGMASVWLAERIDMLQRRQVALKLPHGSWRRAGLAERMQREREILAGLNHPHIATLYDAGVADDGQPYLALEYIEGERIDSHCRRLALDARARLQLFLQVVQAVAHAHANLVVHRDLKPSNILVTAAGVVKLLDFGIAKLLDAGEPGQDALTQDGMRALTPDYAAPEQIVGGPVGTAADVYALGVLLFELLTDTRPYALARDSRAALEEAILAAEVPAPSRVAPAAVARQLRGDLDTVVLKAMQREPAARYATAAALAEDVERWLAHRPVLAHPAGRIERLRKLVRRHRVLVAGSSAVALALLAGAGLALWQAQVARREEARAADVKQFLVSMFESVDPNLAGAARSTSALEMLAAAEGRMTRQLKDQPALRLEIAVAVANGYLGLHEFKRALATCTQVLADTAAREQGSASARVELMLAQALSLRELGDFDAAAQVLDGVPAMLVRSPQARAQRARSLTLQASLAQRRGQWPQALELALQAVDSLPAGGAPAPERAEALLLAARAHSMLRQKEASARSAERALAEQRALHGDDRLHPQVVMATQIYGSALSDLGEYDSARRLLREAVEGARAVYGPDSLFLGESAAWLGSVEMELGQAQQARTLLEEAERVSALRPHDDPLLRAGALRGLARWYIRQRRFDDASRYLEPAWRLLEQGGPPPLRRILDADRQVAAAFVSGPAPALAVLQRLVDEISAGDMRYRGHVPSHYLGLLQRLMGRPGPAVATLQAGLPAARASSRPLELAELQVELAQALLDQGQAGAAKGLLDEAQRTLAARHEALPVHADAALVAGRLAFDAGRARVALDEFATADRYWQQADAGSRWSGEAAYWLARAQAAVHDGAARETAARARQVLGHSPFARDAGLLADLRP